MLGADAGAFWILALSLAVGLGMIAFGLRSWRAARAAAGWPTTPGRILSSEIKVSRDSEGGPSHTVHVRYAYAVDGRDYEAERIAFGYAGGGDHRVQRRLHEHLEAGAAVRVRYDPADPKRAVLGYGTHLSIRIVLVAGLLFATLPLITVSEVAALSVMGICFVSFFALPWLTPDRLVASIERLDPPSR